MADLNSAQNTVYREILPPPPPFYFHSVVGKFKTIGKFQQDRLISFHMPVSGWIYETKPFTSV